MTVQNLLFALIHYARITYPTHFYWLDLQYRVDNYCVFLHREGQKSEQKRTTKNFVGFHNHSPLITMLQLKLKQGVFWNLPVNNIYLFLWYYKHEPPLQAISSPIPRIRISVVYSYILILAVCRDIFWFKKINMISRGSS